MTAGQTVGILGGMAGDETGGRSPKRRFRELPQVLGTYVDAHGRTVTRYATARAWGPPGNHRLRISRPVP